MNTSAPLAPPIISIPERQTQAQRLLGRTLTLLFWLFWIYLWLPLVSLLAWWLGLARAYEVMLAGAGLERLTEMLPVILGGILLLVGGLLLWASYNYLKFHHRQRRSHLPALPLSVMADTVGLPAEILSRAQESRSLIASHDPQGRPIQLTPKPPPTSH